jgi:hypothetical protein
MAKAVRLPGKIPFIENRFCGRLKWNRHFIFFGNEFKIVSSMPDFCKKVP